MANRFAAALKTWKARADEFRNELPIQETIIGALRRAYVGGSDEVTQFLFDEFHYPAKEVCITKEQSIKGRSFLMTPEIWNKLTPRQQDVMDEFLGFKFVGVKGFGNGFINEAAPVYRVYGKSGAFFDYVSSPWQSGAYGGGGAPRFMVVGGVR